MSNKCKICEGTRKEPGEPGCVWCDDTGKAGGLKLDPIELAPGKASRLHQYVSKASFAHGADRHAAIQLIEELQQRLTTTDEQLDAQRLRADTAEAERDKYRKVNDSLMARNLELQAAPQSKVERLEYALKDAFAYKEAAEEKAHELQSTIAQLQAQIAELESGKGEAQISLQPFRDLPYGAKFRYQGGKEVWVRTQHNVIAEWKDKLTRHDRQSLCCFCHLDGDEDGNTLDTLVEVVE